MPTFRMVRPVCHSPEQMFDLVADIERYPEFVPLCEHTQNRRRVEVGEGVETLISTMTVGYKAIRESFTTRVTLDRPKSRVLVEYVDGPFKYLENRWTFRKTETGCDVEFFIDYEFKNVALGLLMGAVFDRAFRKFTVAFEERADAIYGDRRS